MSGCATAPADPSAIARAEVLADQGDLPAALDELEQALRQTPEDPELSIRIGALERERGNLAEAYAAFRRAAELAPEDLRAVSGLALAADALGFRREAEAAYARWAELEGR